MTYTCPMHPEIEQDHPGNCPICGMDLEKKETAAHEEENPELKKMSQRLWTSLALSLPVLFLTMVEMLPAFHDLVSAAGNLWAQLIFSGVVVLWGGWPFFTRAWQSILHRSPNMFTLISMGTGVAYFYHR